MNGSRAIAAIAVLSLPIAACSQSESEAGDETVGEEIAAVDQPAVSAPEAVEDDHAAIDGFLRGYMAEQGDTGEMPTRVATALVPGSDLALAYLMGPFWCGTGGCQLLVLRSDGDGFALVNTVSVARTPIRVLTSSTNGLPDLGVYVAGGGAEGHEARLAFDGARYPGNASVAPSLPSDDAEGTVLIAENAQGRPLDPAAP